MKKKSIDLKSLWERAVKTWNVDSTSTQQSIAIESQALDQSIPSVHPEIAREVPEPIEPEIASNEHEIASTEVTDPSEPSPLSLS